MRAALTLPIDPSVRVAGEARAAVLAPLFEENGETRVVLTRRAATLRSHRSEVSFPGGRAEAGEALVAAAVREACEEVALDPRDVEIIGSLGSLTTVSSRALITPFVGLLATRPELQASPGEVEHVFDIALAELLAEGVHHSEWWSRGGVEFEVHFYALEHDLLWGATARIVTELLGRVTGVLTGPPGAPVFG